MLTEPRRQPSWGKTISQLFQGWELHGEGQPHHLCVQALWKNAWDIHSHQQSDGLPFALPVSCRSHNFLNQKPWHPLNFRNQMRVFEAQEQAEKDAKARAEGKAEFDAEQEYLKTLSYLSPEEQQRYTDRQGVSFMYQKPPGYDAAMSKAAEQVGLS